MNNIEIEPIGSVLHTDREGYLVSQSSMEKLVEPWKVAAYESLEACKTVLKDKLHSVYVRGSASRDEAVRQLLLTGRLVVF